MFHVEQSPPADWLANRLRELFDGLEKLQIRISAQQREQFSMYLSLLWEGNQKVNLFSRKDFDRLANRHILESIGWVKLLKISLSGNCVDVGSGAGFPGIPLKIVFPDINLVLIESIAKKALFLKEVIQKLGLPFTTVLRERAEILSGQAEYRGKFNFGFARAVSSLSNLIQWTRPFFVPGGHLFSIKGGNLASEIKPLDVLVRQKKIKLKIYDYFINFTADPDLFVNRKIVDVEFLSY
ncbi:ribosomal RNA small subunit methyltransferase G [bacterium BMS3Abin05]|nr:ribosomal RNA small subunit methyltransferase G [bacterium BMS3Abin05]GBE28483.1 ribosomal RNA small subunit methyltransferase G [bacterium BMS3Bbin03]HDK35778.1 16S rRNA (guanine(527)-N(7))-methyltransferase RsmG [Bacteroidota bacterium]HDZ11311.1 16S rRNA (guanine(527)-N(7))-methyltransferase RsmG [Bacteroidota bacterium]